MFRRAAAGRSALREFRRLRRVAIREAWRDWTVWLVAVIGIFALAFFTDGFGQLLLAGCLGALLTVGVIGWLIGGHVSSLPWMWGAEGERHTAAELRSLPADTWRVFHDPPLQLQLQAAASGTCQSRQPQDLPKLPLPAGRAVRKQEVFRQVAGRSASPEELPSQTGPCTQYRRGPVLESAVASSPRRYYECVSYKMAKCDRCAAASAGLSGRTTLVS